MTIRERVGEEGGGCGRNGEGGSICAWGSVIIIPFYREVS